MRLVYLAGVRFPNEKAHGLQIAQMCQALGEISTLELVVMGKFNETKESAFKYYQIKENFVVKRIWIPDLLRLFSQLKLIYLLPIAYLFETIYFSVAASAYLFGCNEPIYTRARTTGALLGVLGKVVYFEAHESAKNHLLNRAYARFFSGVVAVSSSVKKSWQTLDANTYYLPDGVNESFFSEARKSEVRKKLNLDVKAKTVVYSGSFYPWKGVGTLIEATYEFAGQVFLIGHPHSLTKVLRKQITENKAVNLLGHIPHSQIVDWLRVADVLVIPNSAKYLHSREDTSPLKLFEYLASGTPIIASAVPAIQEIVSDDHVYFFKPDDPVDLARVISEVMKQPKLKLKQKTTAARTLAKRYTWKARAKQILAIIQ